MELEPKNFELLNRFGDIYYLSNLFDEALIYYKKVIEMDSSNAHAYKCIGNYHMSKKSYSEAICSFSQALKFDSNIKTDLGRAYLLKGDAFKKLKNYELAKSFYEKSIQIEPNKLNLHGKANCLQELKCFTESIECYERLLQFESSYKILVELGNVYLSSQSDAEALLTFDKAIDLVANQSDAYLGKGDAFAQNKMFKEAIAAYDMAIRFELDLDSSKIYNKKGEALICLDDFSEATKCFIKAIEKDSKNDYAHNSLGKIEFIYHKQYEKAISNFDKAISIKPSIPEYHFNKGCALFKMKNFQQAFLSYNQGHAKALKDKKFISSNNFTSLDSKYDLSMILNSESDTKVDEWSIERYFNEFFKMIGSLLIFYIFGSVIYYLFMKLFFSKAK